jgi:hypothetical protein
MSVSCDLCYQVEVPATGLSLVQKSHTECGVSECILLNLNNEEAYVRVWMLRHNNEYRLRGLHSARWDMDGQGWKKVAG